MGDAERWWAITVGAVGLASFAGVRCWLGFALLSGAATVVAAVAWRVDPGDAARPTIRLLLDAAHLAVWSAVTWFALAPPDARLTTWVRRYRWAHDHRR